MNEAKDDKLALDAPLACILFNWSWFLSPAWGWVGIYPPDSPEWVRYNFPDDAEKQKDPAGHPLAPSWHVGGHPAGDKAKLGLPRFSSDWNAMSQLILAMRERGFWWRGTNYAMPNRPAVASFSANTSDWQAEGDTLPQATAKAALLALSGKGQTAGELSDQSGRGLLTSIRNAADRRDDAFFKAWREKHNVGDTAEAAFSFIYDTANLLLEQKGW